MAFEIQYFPEQRLILIRVGGDVSLEEYRDISPRYWTVLQQVDTGVDVLVDLRSMGRFPTSISELRQASINLGSRKVDWVILITGDRPLLKFVATILLQLQTRNGRMRVFDALEGAIRFLKDIHPNARVRANLLDDLYQAVK